MIGRVAGMDTFTNNEYDKTKENFYNLSRSRHVDR